MSDKILQGMWHVGHMGKPPIDRIMREITPLAEEILSKLSGKDGEYYHFTFSIEQSDRMNHG
jgi:hypothetical protein